MRGVPQGSTLPERRAPRRPPALSSAATYPGAAERRAEQGAGRSTAPRLTGATLPPQQPPSPPGAARPHRKDRDTLAPPAGRPLAGPQTPLALSRHRPSAAGVPVRQQNRPRSRRPRRGERRPPSRAEGHASSASPPLPAPSPPPHATHRPPDPSAHADLSHPAPAPRAALSAGRGQPRPLLGMNFGRAGRRARRPLRQLAGRTAERGGARRCLRPPPPLPAPASAGLPPPHGGRAAERIRRPLTATRRRVSAGAEGARPVAGAAG